jgi:hypothetical protein
MSSSVACPTCGTSLKVPTPLAADKLMRCPRCKNNFLLTAQPPSGPAPPQVAPPAPPRLPKRRPRRRDDEEDWPRPKKDVGLRVVHWILIGSGIAFVCLIFCCGFIGLLVQQAIQQTLEEERAARREPQPELPIAALPENRGPPAQLPAEGTTGEDPRPQAQPPTGETPPDDSPREPSRPLPPVSGNSHPAFDPPVRPLSPGQRQVILRVAKLPSDGNPAQLARQALGRVSWVDRETVEVDRDSKEVRFGTFGSSLNTKDAKDALEKVGFRISGATVITPKVKR